MGTRIVLKDAAGNLVDLGSDDLKPDELIKHATALFSYVRGDGPYQPPSRRASYDIMDVTPQPYQCDTGPGLISHGSGSYTPRVARHASGGQPTRTAPLTSPNGDDTVIFNKIQP